MFNSSLLRAVLIILCVSRINFSIPVPDDYSDERISIYSSPEYEAYSGEVISTSTITHASSLQADFTTESQNVLACESRQWEKCVAYLETHPNKDSKEYKQLQNLKHIYTFLQLPEKVVMFGYTELIQVLLRYGLPINQKYALEETVLHLAAEYGHDHLVIFLLTQGAAMQVKNLFGDTPLHSAVRFSKPTTVKLLLDAGADVNATNNFGETPLFQTIKFLNISGYLSDTFSREHEAEYKNRKYSICKDIIKVLLEHGAETNIANYLGSTPLHVAAKNSNSTIVKLLIDGGANINAPDHNNQTPLHVATESNNVGVVAYLIAVGCDKTITDSHGKTALDIAKERNFFDIVDLLSKKRYFRNIMVHVKP